MTKKDFVALADMIIEHNRVAAKTGAFREFDNEAILALAEFCKSQNPKFDDERWIRYIVHGTAVMRTLR